MVSTGKPSPLSATLMLVVSTVTVISGAMPASSQASMPLSTSSFKITSGQSSTPWPDLAGLVRYVRETVV